jgi:histidyl-tRNA synthetase
VNFGGKEEKLSIEMASKLRAIGINTEVYPDNIKLKKQFSYADSNQIPWVVMIGEQERMDSSCILKNMTTGQQDTMPMGEIINHIV